MKPYNDAGDDGRETCLAIDVSRGTTHDGPGLRTTVFLKGCSLQCGWCQNPESIKRGNEVLWEKTKCIACGECRDVCPHGAIVLSDVSLEIDRTKCVACGACIQNCPAKAVVFAAREWNLDELVAEVRKDSRYYETSGGGVTVSGGEPLLQSEFVASLFARLREEGIHCALDTCGFAPATALRRVLPLVDAVLYDLKLLDPREHCHHTTQINELILRNFIELVAYLREQKTKGRNIALWVRTPLIPKATATGENLAAIAGYLQENGEDVVERWELCAFNAACREKYAKLGQEWEFSEAPPMTQEKIDELKKYTAGFNQDKVVVTGIITGNSTE